MKNVQDFIDRVSYYEMQIRYTNEDLNIYKNMLSQLNEASTINEIYHALTDVRLNKKQYYDIIVSEVKEATLNAISKNITSLNELTNDLISEFKDKL